MGVMPDLIHGEKITGSVEGIAEGELYWARYVPLALDVGLRLLLDAAVHLDRIALLPCGGWNRGEGAFERQEPGPGTEIDVDTRVKLWVRTPRTRERLPGSFFENAGGSGQPGEGGDFDRLLTAIEGVMLKYRFRSSAARRRLALQQFEAGFSRMFLAWLSGTAVPELPFDSGESRKLLGIWPRMDRLAGNPVSLAAIVSLLTGHTVPVWLATETLPRPAPLAEENRSLIGRQYHGVGRSWLLGENYARLAPGEVVIGPLVPDEEEFLVDTGWIKKGISTISGDGNCTYPLPGPKLRFLADRILPFQRSDAIRILRFKAKEAEPRAFQLARSRLGRTARLGAPLPAAS